MMDDEIKRQGKHYFEIAKSLVTEKPRDFPGVNIKNLTLINLPIYGTPLTYFVLFHRRPNCWRRETLVTCWRHSEAILTKWKDIHSLSRRTWKNWSRYGIVVWPLFLLFLNSRFMFVSEIVSIRRLCCLGIMPEISWLSWRCTSERSWHLSFTRNTRTEEPGV